MKKTKYVSRRARSGRNLAPKSVAEYIASVPEPARSTLTKLRKEIGSAVPSGATEIISYRIPAFRHKKVLVWYAAFAEHCSLFPTASILEKFKAELKGYKTSKGTVQFPLDQALPGALIRRMVKARVNEVKEANGGARR